MNVSSGTGHPGRPGQFPQSYKTVVCVCASTADTIWPSGARDIVSNR